MELCITNEVKNDGFSSFTYSHKTIHSSYNDDYYMRKIPKKKLKNFKLECFKILM